MSSGQARVLHVSAAPQPVAVELGDDRHVDRIADEIGLAVAEAAEIELHVGGDEALGPGVPFELDVRQSAHRTARAVGADQPVGGKGLLAVRRADRDADPVRGVGERSYLVVEQYLHAELDRVLHRHPGDIVLPGMQLIVVGNALDRLGADHRRIAEFGDVGAEVAILEPDRIELVQQAQLFQDDQRRGEINCGPRAVDDLGLTLEHRDRGPALGQRQRGQHSDRPGPDHDHVLAFTHR